MAEFIEKAEEPRFRLADIFGSMREGILILNNKMTVTASNSAAGEAFSNDPSELNGRRLSEIVRDFDLHEAFQQASAEGKRSEVRLEIVDTNKRIFDVIVSPLRLSDEFSAIGVFYEVTRVERLERVRQEFLSNISHELRTPLTSIMAFVETLSDGAIDDHENRLRFLDVIRKNAERMHLLIDDISELSSIEARQVRINREELDLADAVDEVFTNLKAAAAKRDVALVNEVPKGTRIQADRMRFEQMITNLVDNAIKFNRESGDVTISHTVEDDRSVISVKDAGEGISKEHLARIFERFYRVDKARSREVGGTGLGLAIVKHLARLHDGEVTVESSISRGTKFSIFLPLA